jgi:hypothetical protein
MFDMKRICTALATLATTITLGAVPSVLMASPAEAANATPGCITRTEFRAVTRGTTMRRATEIIGAAGRTSSSNTFSDGDVWRTLEFRQCGRTWYWSSVSFDFEATETEVWDSYWDDWETRYSLPLRVTAKYAYWS